MADAARRACLQRGFAVLAVVGLPLAAAPAPEAITGTWWTDEGASKVEIVAGKAGDGSTVFNGKAVWLKQAQSDGKPLRDAHNSDPALRDRPILGLQILSGFKAAGDGWSGGTV